MTYKLILAGESRSFPEGDPFLRSDGNADILVIAGAEAGDAFARLQTVDDYALVLIELGTECLGVHTGESRGKEGGKVLGFARFRLGALPPTALVEIVRQPCSDTVAIERAQALFEAAGLKTAICGDFPGRIIDRLVRPYYNAALNRLDARLTSAADMDLTLKLGLGYPTGPIELLEESGLEAHFAVTSALYHALGDPDYYPARRAQVAAIRSERGQNDAAA